MSPFHTSNEDSGEWKAVVEKMRSLKSEEPSSQKKRNSVEVNISILNWCDDEILRN